VTSAARSPGARQAGHYLRELLGTTYRHRWAQPHLAQRDRTGEVHQAAVARVIAGYLWDHPRRPGDRQLEAEQLRDLVSRALNGTVLSRQTLQLFIEAIPIEAADAQTLWRQWESREPARVVVGDLPPNPHAPQGPQAQIILLHEFHYLGADGRPYQHRTIQEVRSTVDGLASYRHSFDTANAHVERVHGGVPSAPYQLDGTLWAVDIELPRTLGVGGVASMEYITKLHYSHDVEPCFRRAAHQRYERVAIRVQFHPDRLPKRLWWAEWKDYREPDSGIVLHREPVELDDDHAVDHCLDVLDRAVVGFTWEF